MGRRDAKKTVAGAVREEEVGPGQELRIASREVWLKGVEGRKEVVGWVAESGCRC